MRKHKKLGLPIVILLGICLVLFTILKPKQIETTGITEENVDIKRKLETKYTKPGSYDVGYIEYKIDDEVISKYSIWYPKSLERDNKKYPVIIIANGTGAIANSHKELFDHLASWGFIVVGNEDTNSWSGESTSKSLDYIIKLNDNKDSIFFNKIDIYEIGASGHSQGGVGAINAVTKYENSNYFKSIYTASCAWVDLSETLGWDYDTTKINIPYFMIAGTGNIDSGIISPVEAIDEVYNKLENNHLTVMARRRGADHGEILEWSKGYMTAWFLYTLNSNEEAKKVFCGNNPEITINTDNWQDVRIKNAQ